MIAYIFGGGLLIFLILVMIFCVWMAKDMSDGLLNGSLEFVFWKEGNEYYQKIRDINKQINKKPL